MPSRARSLVPNPPWVTQAITAAWESLTTKVKPEWIPRLEDVHSARGHVVGDFQEYGCGAYGCVYPTLDPGVVLKVTTDETEAEFAAYLSKDLVAPIVTTYRMVMSLPAEHEGRRIYLLWRESADDVGGIVEGSNESNMIWNQHKAAQKAYNLLFDGVGGPKLERALAEWKHRTQQMAMYPELGFVAGGMLAVFDQQGIFFGDIHAGNLGRVLRNGKPTWVISDPGHVAVIGEQHEREHLAIQQADDGGRARTHRQSIGSRETETDHRANPYQEGVGSWKAPQIFADTLNARMLRLLWERGSMTQAEFMQRYHKVGAQLMGERRSTRLTEGNTAFLNNLGRYVRGYSVMPGDWLRESEGLVPLKGGAVSVSGPGAYGRLEATRQQAVKYLLPIERRIDGNPIDGQGWQRRRDTWHRATDKKIILHWVGPTVDEWLAALTTAELDKAYQSMDRIAVGSGDPLDATWLARIHAEVVKRGGGTVDHRPTRNPPARSTDDLDATIQNLLRDADPGAMEAIRDACLEQGDFATILAGVGERMFEKAYKNDPHAKLKVWLLWNATFDVFAEPEQEDPGGHFENAEDVAFARTADEYNVWPWCSVTVQATYGEHVGEDHLGGCSYEDQYAFTRLRGYYYDDMKRSAVDDLISEMSDHLIETLSNNVVAGRLEVAPMKDLGQGQGERSVEWFLWGRSQRTATGDGWHAYQRTYRLEYQNHRWNFASDYGGDFADNLAYAAVGAYLTLPVLHVRDRPPELVERAVSRAMDGKAIKRLVDEGGYVGRPAKKRRKR